METGGGGDWRPARRRRLLEAAVTGDRRRWGLRACGLGAWRVARAGGGAAAWAPHAWPPGAGGSTEGVR